MSTRRRIGHCSGQEKAEFGLRAAEGEFRKAKCGMRREEFRLQTREVAVVPYTEISDE
jgi:hypothetical protein